jgi:hypothetical protein
MLFAGTGEQQRDARRVGGDVSLHEDAAVH